MCPIYSVPKKKMRHEYPFVLILGSIRVTINQCPWCEWDTRCPKWCSFGEEALYPFHSHPVRTQETSFLSLVQGKDPSNSLPGELVETFYSNTLSWCFHPESSDLSPLCAVMCRWHLHPCVSLCHIRVTAAHLLNNPCGASVSLAELLLLVNRNQEIHFLWATEVHVMNALFPFCCSPSLFVHVKHKLVCGIALRLGGR